jgi:hypothetical protein
MHFGYEYFCGANVVIEIENFPILEAIGIRINAQESKVPIYGYSSRHFDAVARGRVLIEGSLVINYVHQDYLFRATEIGLIKNGLLTKKEQQTSDLNPLVQGAKDNSPVRKELYDALKNNYEDNLELVEAFKQGYWNKDEVQQNNTYTGALSPFDIYGGVNIRVTFGKRDYEAKPHANIGYDLKDVYFTSRGHLIQIDEKVIVEEYNFFAREIRGIRKQYKHQTKTKVQEEQETASGPDNTEMISTIKNGEPPTGIVVENEVNEVLTIPVPTKK